MGLSESTLFQVGIWLIPISLLLGVGVAVAVVSLWQRHTHHDLRALRRALRSLHSHRNQISLSVKGRSKDEPEPFGSRIAALQEELSHLDSQISTLEFRFIRAQERVRFLKTRRWEFIVGAPYFWYLMRNDVAALNKELEAVEGVLSNSQALASQVDSVAWEVAIQARQLTQLLEKNQHLAERMHEKGLSGESMQNALQQIGDIKQSLADIPLPLLIGDEKAVRTQVRKEHVAQIHSLIVDYKPHLENLLEQLNSWERKLYRLQEAATTMVNSMDEVRNLIAALPPQVDVDGIQAQLSHIQLHYENLIATLDAPRVEDLDDSHREASKRNEMLAQIIRQLQQAVEGQAQLDSLLQSLNDNIKRLSFLFTDLNTHAVFPITWGESMRQYTEINRQVKALGAADKPRTPDEIQQVLRSTQSLRTQVNLLSEHLKSVQEQHSLLVKLISAPAMDGMLTWLENGMRIAHQAQDYAAENWPKQLAPHDLAEKLDGLRAEFEQYIAGDKRRAVTEERLSEKLAHMRAFNQSFSRLTQQVEEVGTKLRELREMEGQAVDGIEKARAYLSQLRFLTQSNPYLTETAARDLDKLTGELESVSQSLQEKRRGKVEKKAPRVVALLGKIEAHVNQWLRNLQQDILEKGDRLARSLDGLKAIVSLDEQALEDAAHILAEVNDLGKRAPRFPIEDLIPQLKRRCDLWQSCVAALKAVDEVVGPVLQAFEDAETQRQTALREFKALSDKLNQRRLWPPTTVTLENEQSELDQLESQWKTVGEKRQRAIRAVAELGNLSAKYQALSQRINQSRERMERQGAQIEEWIGDLDNLAMQWQEQWQLHRDQRHVRDAIDRLLEEMDAEINQLKRRYWRREIHYNHILMELKSLHNRVRTHEVDLEDDFTLDIGGRIRRRR